MAEHRSFAEERESLLEEVKMLPPGAQALEKLRFLREEYDWAIPDYRNSLNILSDTTYEDRKHFLLELIQNADDARYGNKSPEITFAMLEDGIELEYNEKGFTAEDVIAITGTGSSTKSSKKHNANSFIGEKGIGFKSVFALASEVEIESLPWHFKLHKDKCIVPDIIYDSINIQSNGTRQRIKFTDKSMVNVIYKELQRYVSGEVESFLFLQKIAKFNLIDRRQPNAEVKSIAINPTKRNGDTLILTDLPSKNERKYLLYKEQLEFSEALVAERWEKIGASMGTIKRNIIVAALVDSDDKTEKKGRLFCYLPTAVKLPVPIFLQVDGQTKADRERLHDPENNNWNKYLLSKLPDFLVRAILGWRDKPHVGERLMEFIPDNSGEDQLKEVFQKFRYLLLTEPWVKVLDCETAWASPSECTIADSYMSDWFERYPSFRAQAELVIGKKIVHPDWCDKSEKRSKLDIYRVGRLYELEIARILEGCILPEEIFQGDNLFNLYSYILDFNAIKDADKETTWRPTIEKIKKTRDYLAKAKIFPIKNHGFEGLKEDEGQKVYYVSGASRLESVMDQSSEIRLIDNEYTCISTAIEDEAEEENEVINKKNKRNKALRSLLNFLGVKEMNETTQLTDMQIPWLIKSTSESNEEKFKVLTGIFSYYTAKGQNSKEYTKNLVVIQNAYFFTDRGKYIKLRNMLLPQMLRITEEDKTYDGSVIPVMEVPDCKKEFVESNAEGFRKFLIDCGIKNEPKFEVKIKDYQPTSKFSLLDEEKFKFWRKRVGNDYTPANYVTVETVSLSQEDIDIIEAGLENIKVLEKKIYKLWEKSFSNEQINCDTYYYKYSVLPGYFKVSYTRRERRNLLIKASDWAGIREGIMPVRSTNGLMISCSNAFYIKMLTNNQFSYLLNYLPAVVAKDSEDQNIGYKENYLESLGIRKIRLSDLDILWGKVNHSRYKDILSFAIEMKGEDCKNESLMVYDKDSQILRDIQEFKLGRMSFEDAPLIEVQYGEVGEAIGKLFKLKEESTATTYSGILASILKSVVCDGKTMKRFHNLLNEWCTWNAADKVLIAKEMQNCIQEFGYTHDPLIVFNDEYQFSNITDAGIKAVLLNVDDFEDEKYELEKAAKELGFMLPDSLGEMKTIDETALIIEEKAEYKRLFELYMELLEPAEVSRLNHKLMPFGGSCNLYNKIIKAVNAYRVLKDTELKVSVDLPYIDYKAHRIIVSKKAKSFKVIEDILVMTEFTTRRSALRDMEEIERLYLSELRKIHEKEIHKEKALNVELEERETNTTDTKVSISGREEVSLAKEEPLNNENKKLKNIRSEISSAEIVESMKSSLKGDIADTEFDNYSDWKTGLSPEEEEKFRSNLAINIKESLDAGPSIYSKKFERSRKVVKALDGRELLKDEKIVDDDSVNSKEFLKAEYSGRCQICGTELTFSNGEKWVSVYHIMDKKEGAWWSDRPFNILGMCPNCYTIAKHGMKKDLSNIFTEAQAIIEGDIFPEEVPEFNGDYYIVDIMVNGEHKKLKVSKVHMNYFAALLGNYEGVIMQEKC